MIVTTGDQLSRSRMKESAQASDAWRGAEYREHTAHHRTHDPPALWNLGLGSGDALLDVGCGVGDLTVALAEHYRESEVIGLDASASQIEQARRHGHPRVRFEVGKVQDLQWRERFRAVISIACLHWIPVSGHPLVLERIFWALAPGGRFIASFAARENIADIRKIIFSVARRPPFEEYVRGRLPHHPWASLDQYRQIVAESPFGGAQELRTETQPRSFSHTQLLGWLRTQTLTGYRNILPPEIFAELVETVGRQVADLTKAGPDRHVVPFVRLQLQARRPSAKT